MPPARLTNDDLAELMDTSDEWIRTRTGISERRVSHVSASELARVAGARALASAGLTAAELDLIILATASPDTLIPCAAAHLQRELAAENAGAFDLNAGCTGFVYALAMAASLLETGLHQKILVVGAERLSWYLEWSRRETAVLFGDGAGAVVLEAVGENQGGLLAWVLGCDGHAADAISVLDFGTSVDRFAPEFGHFQLQFDGREVFKRAVRGMYEASISALEQSDVGLDQIDLVVPHQANQRIIDALTQRLGIDPQRVMMNIADYGNTSAATIPVALTEALEQDRLKPGDHLLMAAFGAGLTWAAATMRWVGQLRTPMTSDARLSPCAQTGLELVAQTAEQQRRIRAS